MAQEEHMASEVSLPSDFAGGGQLFVRNATGLVREVSKWDALIMNTLGMNVALGAIFMLLQAPGDFPGGNMLLAIGIGTLVMAFTLLWVYSEFAAAMPRAGGDYVFVSRALHPIAGWLMSWSQGLWLIFFWIGFNAWFALTFAAPVAMTTLGAVTGHAGWITLSNDLLAKHTIIGITTQWWVILFGTVLTFGFAALLIYGSRSYWRVQKWLFAIAGVGILLVAGLLLFRGNQIAQSWTTFATTNKRLAFNNIIPAANAAGFNGNGAHFSLTAILLMLPSVLLLVWSHQHAVGRDWAASLSYLSNTASPKLALPGAVPPGINLIASLLTGSVPLLLIIGVGFILWALMGTPLSTLQATRYMLAWSLDRVVPKQLGQVSDTFHTPIKAILVCAVTGEIALFALVQIPQASLLGALLAQIAAFIVVSIAGILFPYRLKAVWESAGGRRILGVPAVTLAGIGGGIAPPVRVGGVGFYSSIPPTLPVPRPPSPWV